MKEKGLKVLFPVKPFGFVGLGVLLGVFYHGLTNWDIIFAPGKSDFVMICMLTVYISSFSLILGNFMYQLMFAVFHYFNQKLITSHVYRIALERCMQLLFGLCLGGFVLYMWDKMMTRAICIPKDYCPDSAVMLRILVWKNQVCSKEGQICKNFFHVFPAFIQTLKAVLASVFVQYIWEKSKLRISMTVYKPKTL